VNTLIAVLEYLQINYLKRKHSFKSEQEEIYAKDVEIYSVQPIGYIIERHKHANAKLIILILPTEILLTLSIPNKSSAYLKNLLNGLYFQVRSGVQSQTGIFSNKILGAMKIEAQITWKVRRKIVQVVSL
jgi:hypothetical protein